MAGGSTLGQLPARLLGPRLVLGDSAARRKRPLPAEGHAESAGRRRQEVNRPPPMRGRSILAGGHHLLAFFSHPSVGILQGVRAEERGHLAPAPAQVRAEVWMSLIHGLHRAHLLRHSQASHRGRIVRAPGAPGRSQINKGSELGAGPNSPTVRTR